MANKIWQVTGKIKIDGVVTAINDVYSAKNEAEVKRQLNDAVADFRKKHTTSKPYDISIVEDTSGRYKPW